MQRLVFCVLVTACAPSTPPSPRGTAPPSARSAVGASDAANAPAASSSAALASKEPATAPPLAALSLEPAPTGTTLASNARVAILRPAPAEVVPTSAASRYVVRVDRGGATNAARVLVALDGGRPRNLPAQGSLALGDLLPADRVLAEGVHTLFAVLADGAGYGLRRPGGDPPWAVVDFAVGRSGESRVAAHTTVGAMHASAGAPPPPRLFCLAPVGTFHGKEAERLPLDVYAVGPAPPTLPLAIDGPGVAYRGSLDPARPYLIGGLPSGDFRVRAGAPSDGAQCIVSVNRDVERGS